jgi:anti-repressor protein
MFKQVKINKEKHMELQVFKNQNFGEIRTIMKEGNSWFFGKDIAKVLGYSNTRDALSRHVEADDKAAVVIHDGGQNRNMSIINESGVYALIFRSTLPKSKQFKRWVTSEVLPSIRKHGMYAIDELLDNPDFMIKTFQKIQENKNGQLSFG